MKGFEIDKERYVVFTSAELQDIMKGITGGIVRRCPVCGPR